MSTTLEQINAHLAAIADLARQQQQAIERLLAAAPAPPPQSRWLKGVVSGWPTDADTPHHTALGHKLIRVWHNIDWNRTPAAGDLRALRSYKTTGLKVALRLHTNTPPPSEARAAAWFDALASALGGAADYVGALNEPNWTPDRWTGTVDQAIAVARACYKALDGKVPVTSICIGNSESAFERYVRAGMLDHCDVAAFNCYGHSAQHHIDRLKLVVETAKGKPVLVEEFGLHVDSRPGKPGRDVWLRDMPQIIAWHKANVVGSCYYRLRWKDDRSAQAMHQALVDAENKPREPYYATWRSAAS